MQFLKLNTRTGIQELQGALTLNYQGATYIRVTWKLEMSSTQNGEWSTMPLTSVK